MGVDCVLQPFSTDGTPYHGNKLNVMRLLNDPLCIVAIIPVRVELLQFGNVFNPTSGLALLTQSQRSPFLSTKWKMG
jgi:hypothetical protein